MTAYALYNEIDPFAAAWLEQLIARGLIAPGVVDRRSIEDIRPDDLRGFRQVHFFAGIGVWSYALRRAGVPDDANVWTGSCPCQPFSAAGKGGGVDDERHLWPHFHHLIRECRPELVFGEQVASKDGLAWLDLVHADMEGTGHAFGAVDTCSAGFGAPHIRQRLYWFSERLANATRVDSWAGLRNSRSTGQRRDFALDGCSFERLGNSVGAGLEGYGRRHSAEAGQRSGSLRPVAKTGEFGGMADHDHDGLSQVAIAGIYDASHNPEPRGGDVGLAYDESEQQPREVHQPGERSAACGEGVPTGGRGDAQRMADGPSGRWGEERSNGGRIAIGDRTEGISAGPLDGSGDRWTGPTNGFWEDVDWLHCRDERWRPVEPGTFPLAHGAAARVGRLRGYGNAINAEQALGFLEAFFEAKAIEVAPIHETTRNLDARSLTAELLGDLL